MTLAKSVDQNEYKPFELSFGAGALSGAYNSIEDHWPVEACREALRLGINSFDTSPYYGKSEFILGDALQAIKDEFPRSSYYISTKVGRYGYSVKDFDYSAERVTASVEESMKRLHTDYLDIVFCHDVEFVPFEHVVGPNCALEALFRLKDQGKIKYVGVSGYPLEVLLRIAEHQSAQGRPLDIVLSYCHYTLQNTMLAKYTPQFRAAGVRYVLNASPLGMALFREAGPPDWHPAHPPLREAAHKCASLAKENGLNISELASMFAFAGRDAFNLTSTVIGLQKKEEVRTAIDAWQLVKQREQGTQTVPQVEANVMAQITDLLRPFKDFSWQSPSAKEMADPSQ
ncbi:NADP-dependent oxidoreductase domain-containing protein [Radiomyces spectabilis]|uniref:NADP-dependent oxidoreductase domain-containing protein n=1 Tax=Radiomyces spectabilis TaxID=64574 RepID=UPI0022202843|nr:NADP-dependent oxidoreductase domain-containing protein [Radiomyces spectabilis]KAI8388205.1 NADP-dependent oxidoreductase domain-containing protein [Radiomyces spectabilis]